MIMTGIQLSWHLVRKRQKIGKTGSVILSLELVVTIWNHTYTSKTLLTRSLDCSGGQIFKDPFLQCLTASMGVEKVVEVANPEGRGGSRKAPSRKENDKVPSLQARHSAYNLGPCGDHP